jgi:hypothetical protein
LINWIYLFINIYLIVVKQQLINYNFK